MQHTFEMPAPGGWCTTWRVLLQVAVVLAALETSGPAVAHPGLHQDIERLTTALTEHPDNVDLLIERAECYRTNDYARAALADLDRVLSLDGDRVQAWLLRGLTLADLRRDREAEQELTRFLRISPEHVGALAARARVRGRLGQVVPAVADYDAAITLQDDVALYLERGLLLEKLGRLDEAARGYRTGFQRNGGAVTLRKALIRVELARGDHDSAQALIDEVLERAAVKTEWLLLRADVHEAAGRPESALADRRRALAEANRALKKRATLMNLYMRFEAHVALNDLESVRRDLQLINEAERRRLEILERTMQESGGSLRRVVP